MSYLSVLAFPARLLCTDDKMWAACGNEAGQAQGERVLWTLLDSRRILVAFLNCRTLVLLEQAMNLNRRKSSRIQGPHCDWFCWPMLFKYKIKNLDDYFRSRESNLFTLSLNGSGVQHSYDLYFLTLDLNFSNVSWFRKALFASNFCRALHDLRLNKSTIPDKMCWHTL